MENDLPLSFEQRLAAATKKTMTQVAPGENVYTPEPGQDAPEFVLAKFVRIQNTNTYKLIPYSQRMARVNEKLMSLLGFPSSQDRPVQYQTLRRLANAGFIEMIQISPGTWMLDVDSWFRHLRYCVQNPDCWEQGSEDRKTYLFRNNLGEWSKK